MTDRVWLEVERDIARSEVARLRALCAEAAPQVSLFSEYGSVARRRLLGALAARLAAAGKGEP
jgi:hypothetical protein